jgi:hypothetical protein
MHFEEKTAAIFLMAAALFLGIPYALAQMKTGILAARARFNLRRGWLHSDWRN